MDLIPGMMITDSLLGGVRTKMNSAGEEGDLEDIIGLDLAEANHLARVLQEAREESERARAHLLERTQRIERTNVVQRHALESDESVHRSMICDDEFPMAFDALTLRIYELFGPSALEKAAKLRLLTAVGGGVDAIHGGLSPSSDDDNDGDAEDDEDADESESADGELRGLEAYYNRKKRQTQNDQTSLTQCGADNRHHPTCSSSEHSRTKIKGGERKAEALPAMTAKQLFGSSSLKKAPSGSARRHWGDPKNHKDWEGGTYDSSNSVRALLFNFDRSAFTAISTPQSSSRSMKTDGQERSNEGNNDEKGDEEQQGAAMLFLKNSPIAAGASAESWIRGNFIPKIKPVSPWAAVDRKHTNGRRNVHAIGIGTADRAMVMSPRTIINPRPPDSPKKEAAINNGGQDTSSGVGENTRVASSSVHSYPLVPRPPPPPTVSVVVSSSSSQLRPLPLEELSATSSSTAGPSHMKTTSRKVRAQLDREQQRRLVNERDEARYAREAELYEDESAMERDYYREVFARERVRVAEEAAAREARVLANRSEMSSMRGAKAFIAGQERRAREEIFVEYNNTIGHLWEQKTVILEEGRRAEHAAFLNTFEQRELVARREREEKAAQTAEVKRRQAFLKEQQRMVNECKHSRTHQSVFLGALAKRMCLMCKVKFDEKQGIYVRMR